MIQLIARRLSYGILIIILVVTIISSIIYLAPIDPSKMTFGQRSDKKTMELKRSALGLDKPLYVQLALYLKDLSPIDIIENNIENSEKYRYINIFQFNNKLLVLKYPYLRESYQTGRKVSTMLLEAVPQTAILAFSAMLIASIIGIFLGVVAALKPHSWFDKLAMVSSVLGYSLPSYAIAMILALVFGYSFANFTGLNIQGSLFELNDLGDEVVVWKNLILPAIALGLRPIALILQLTRNTMLDVLSMDFIRTARAKGLSEKTIIIRHALRNALNPVATAISGWLAGLLAGAFFIENVFNFNGLGQLTVTALLNFDIPVVLGAVLLTSTIFVLINIIVDILYGVLDPRVSV